MSGAYAEPQRLVIGSDLVVRVFLLATQTEPSWAYRVKLKKHRVDGDGSTCCQLYYKFVEGGSVEGLALCRVDKLGKVYEENLVPLAPEEGKAAEVAFTYLQKVDPELPESMKKKSGVYLLGVYHIYERKQ